MDTYRLCRVDNHSQCAASVCQKRANLEDKARECFYARLILDELRNRGIPWEKLGNDMAPMRKAAQWKMSDYPYLVEEFQPEMNHKLEARYLAEDIISGRLTYFPNEGD